MTAPTKTPRRRRHPRSLTQMVRDLQARVAVLERRLNSRETEQRALAAAREATARGVRA